MRKLFNPLIAVFVIGLLAIFPAFGQVSPYVYVEMSLGVPWFLYFVFLACILIPFFVLIIVAWRRHIADERNTNRN